VLLGLVLAAFAYWVWPTAWRYDYMTDGEGHRQVVRMHRVTARTQAVWYYGWVDLRRPVAPRPPAASRTSALRQLADGGRYVVTGAEEALAFGMILAVLGVGWLVWRGAERWAWRRSARGRRLT
jgi:hypothetical protein